MQINKKGLAPVPKAFFLSIFIRSDFRFVIWLLIILGRHCEAKSLLLFRITIPGG